MISSKLIHNGPTTGLIRYWTGRFFLWLFSWDVVGRFPKDKKFIIITAPHTSNWDFPLGILAIYIYRLKCSWIGKDSLFKKPFGVFMRWLGGIAVNRDSQHGVVDQIAKQFRESIKLAIAIAPSGTRKKGNSWKSGFYWMAHKAQVPIVCAYFDYKRRETGIGLSFIPTGNVKMDMDRIREFYKLFQAKHQDMITPIRLKDEDA
ncbi:MAG: acyltransferase [Calditrichaeota bacterium]|nr:MAG: acyltransferase [Calditrichota bacterium]MBL1204840.1 acyltransferase [Calditrichota bacterium]NOG44669.1 acyltransferase [Calditrichota bacterium]